MGWLKAIKSLMKAEDYINRDNKFAAYYCAKCEELYSLQHCVPLNKGKIIICKECFNKSQGNKQC